MSVNRKMSKFQRTEFWKQELELYQRSGKSLQDFSRDRGYGASTLHGWRSKLGLNRSGGAFKLEIPILRPKTLALPIDANIGSDRSCSILKIKNGPIEIEINEGASPIWVAEMVRQLVLSVGRG